MLDILQAPNYVAAFRLSSEISKQDYDRIVAEIESRLQQHARIAIYVELADASHFTIPALLTDLRYALAKIGQWRRFARVALVTEKGWARGFMQVFAPFLSGIEGRVFAASESDRALAWVTELRPDARQAALRLIPTSRPDTYGVVWKGRITSADVDTVMETLKRELEAHISARVLVRIEDLGGIEPAAAFKSGLLRAKLLGIRKIERYAVAGGPAWLGRYADMISKVSGLEMRYFPIERESEAWAWLEAQPTSREQAAAGQAEAVASANDGAGLR
ncbi:MAG TPA: STAS/SEC14 domain-containing protein [Polyangiales bacterium]|nr:STAS/SEC14 domain-containing protein [Polyangiales bacterium]